MCYVRILTVFGLLYFRFSTNPMCAMTAYWPSSACFGLACCLGSWLNSASQGNFSFEWVISHIKTISKKRFEVIFEMAFFNLVLLYFFNKLKVTFMPTLISVFFFFYCWIVQTWGPFLETGYRSNIFLLSVNLQF